MFRGWAPAFWGSSSTTSSSHRPRGPLKWQVAELIMEGAHLQVEIVQRGHLLPVTKGSGQWLLVGPGATGLVEGVTQARPPKTSPSSHALSLLPHSGFILSVSSRFLARKASSWARRRVELRASALTCLAKAWRSSSWGEECRRRWACLTGLGVEGAGSRRARGRGPWGPHSSPPGYPIVPPAGPSIPQRTGLPPCPVCWVCPTACPLMHWPSASQQALSQHLPYFPQMPTKHHTLNMDPIM